MLETLERLFPDGLLGIAFDCDGVMIDSEAANRYLYNTILTALGLPKLTDTQEIFAFQATFLQAVQSLVPPGLQNRIDAVCAEKIDYDRDILPKIRIMPGYAAFLEKARVQGLRMAVDTNRTARGVHKVLDFLGLPPYFEPVISCEDVAPKPSPRGPRKICELWAIQPHQVLFVGDSPDDRTAAKDAGMVFVGFGGLKGDVSVADWDELANLLWPRMHD